MPFHRPMLPVLRILALNAGFFGIQYSFGLQQSNMSPIYRYLGAEPGQLPWLWLAGPVTGLVLQPIAGALSDRTLSRLGRRLPYLLAGGLTCGVCLVTMPFSTMVWMAAGLLWVLDAGNNVAMQPCRALVADVLPERQQPLGYLTQSALTGLAQTLAYLTPPLLVWMGMGVESANRHNIPQVTMIAFVIGAGVCTGSVLITCCSVREPPLPQAELERLRRVRRGMWATLAEIVQAMRQMPPLMRRLALVMLLQWYAMSCYWQYIVLALARSVFGTSDPASSGFREAALVNGQIGGFYNFVAFVAALLMVPIVRRFSPCHVHALCLLAAGIGMSWLPSIESRWLLLVPMLGIGLAWASMMGNPYLMLAQSIPPERTGVYMGLFNLFIVVPMLIQILTLPLYYDALLGGDPRHVIRLAGGLLLAASLAMRWVPARSAHSP